MKQPGSRVPTFLVIGAQRGGTTWLYEMVRQHPEVSVSVPKEINFFYRAEIYARGFSWYLQQFENDSKAITIGEFAPNYLWTEVDPTELPEFELVRNVPAVVHRHLPNVRLVVSLRDPVERAISAWYHHIRARRFSPRERLRDCMNSYGITSIGHYDVHLSNWFRYFPRERLLVLFYEEDFAGERKAKALKKVFTHIGCNPDFRPDGLEQRFNERKGHFDMRTRRWPRLMRRLARRFVPAAVQQSGAWKIGVEPADLEALLEHFAPHNQRLARLLGRPLPWQAFHRN